MKIKKNTRFAISLILVFAFAMSMAAVLPSAMALDIPTYPLITVNPDPIGVGQTAYINAFMSKPTPTAGMGGSGDQYEGIMIKIWRPDGTTQQIGPLRSDSTGGTWASFIPKTNGTYKFQMTYPGGTLKGGGTVFMGGSFNWTGSKLLPSESEIVELHVQNEPIGAIYQTPPLPTEYWTRPIYGTNYAWNDLGGSWYGLAAPSFATTGQYDAMGNFQEYTTAPNTGHIVWKKPTHFGGIVGAPITGDQSSQYEAASIAINHFEPVILNGVIYYTMYASASSKNTGWAAVDLRTGETIWTRTAGESGSETIKMGQILRFHTQQEYGSVAYLWSSPATSMFQSASYYSVYDAKTGVFLSNITSISGASYLVNVDHTEQQGELLGWYATNGWLRMWNSTLMILGGNKATTLENATAVKFSSASYNWTNGIQYSMPIPNNIGSAIMASNMSVAAVTPDIILARYYASPGMFQEMGYGYQTTAGFNAKTGQLLWGPINQTTPYLQDVALLCARDGVYVLHNKDTDEAYGYSLTNGAQLWGPVQLAGNAWSHISRDAEIAYGKVLLWDFGGYVNALNKDTGAIEWTITPRSAGYDTPFGIYPLWHFGTQSICDGKLFLSEGHMYNPPMHPSLRLAINISNGELVWSIMSYSGRITGVHADTYFVEWDSLDTSITTFGKGPTATSVTASPKVSTEGGSVLIEGRVIDTSAGTEKGEVAVRFPDGVPAVSDESMSPYMEYVYMQQIKPTNTTGVPVHLTAVDPNGNTQEIGIVTTKDGNFATMWTPPVPGVYTIKASFEGSESYYISYGETAIGVTQASAAPATAPPETQGPTESPPVQTATPVPTTAAPEPPKADNGTLIYVSIAAVAIIVVIVAAAVVLRRRK